MSEERTFSISSNDETMEITGAEFEAIKKKDPEFADAIKGWEDNPKLANKIIGKDVKMRVKQLEGAETTSASIYFEQLDSEPPTSDEERLPMSNENNGFETLFKELKDDMRERETRTHEEIKEREQRFERQLDKYQQEGKEREDRFYELTKEIKNDTKEYKQTIQDGIKQLEEKFDKTQSKMDDSLKHLESMKRTTFWGQIAFIVSVAAIIVTFILTVI